jgi:hypothetical protein
MREFLKEEKYYSRRIRKFLKDIVNEWLISQFPSEHQ